MGTPLQRGAKAGRGEQHLPADANLSSAQDPSWSVSAELSRPGGPRGVGRAGPDSCTRTPHGHASSLHCGSRWKGLNFSNEQDPASRSSGDGSNDPGDGVMGSAKGLHWGCRSAVRVDPSQGRGQGLAMRTPCRGLNCVPQTRTLKFQPPAPHDVIFFGNRVI